MRGPPVLEHDKPMITIERNTNARIIRVTTNFIRSHAAFVAIVLVCGAAVTDARSPQGRPDVGRLSFSVTSLYRSSTAKDAAGRNVRPFDAVSVDTYFNRLPIVPKPGMAVTIVPLAPGLDPFNLKIVRVMREEACGDEKRWNLEFEPVAGRALAEAPPVPDRTDEYPFDVCVIFPAVKTAVAMQGDRLDRQSLPRGVSAPTIVAAIDVTGDGKPDLLETSYCCDREQHRSRRSVKDCDYTCGKAFRKVAGRWRLIEQFSPC